MLPKSGGKIVRGTAEWQHVFFVAFDLCRQCRYRRHDKGQGRGSIHVASRVKNWCSWSIEEEEEEQAEEAELLHLQ